MVRAALCVALLALCSGLTLRAEDAHEKLAIAMIDSIGELTTLMEACKDVESAKATAPKLSEAVKKFKALDEEGKKLGEPAKEVKEALEKKYDEKIVAAIGKMQKEGERIAKSPEIAKEIEEPMKALSGQ